MDYVFVDCYPHRTTLAILVGCNLVVSLDRVHQSRQEMLVHELIKDVQKRTVLVKWKGQLSVNPVDNAGSDIKRYFDNFITQSSSFQGFSIHKDSCPIRHMAQFERRALRCHSGLALHSLLLQLCLGVY